MIYPEHTRPSQQPTMMSVRLPHDPYRSLPCTPLGMDPRNLAAMDLAPILNHARMGLEAQDYFSSPRYGGSMRGSSPYPQGMDAEGGFHNAGAGVGAGAYSGNPNPTNLSGLVCKCGFPSFISHQHSHPATQIHVNDCQLTNPFPRTNLAATLANAQISPTSKYGNVFPHMNEEGRYPSDFNLPRTVEYMKVLDSRFTPGFLSPIQGPSRSETWKHVSNPSHTLTCRLPHPDSQLDRIMLSYRLPLDLRGVPTASSSSGRISPYGSGSSSRDAPISSSRVRQAKLHALWEFLGCWKLVEHERLRRGGY